MDKALVLQLVQGVWPPLVVGLVVWAFAWLGRIGRAERAHATVKRNRDEPYWVAPVLLGVASVVMHAVLFGGWKLAPVSAGDWRPHIALAAMVLGLIGAVLRPRAGRRWLARVVLLLGVGFVGSIGRVAYLWKGEDFRTEAAWSIPGAVVWLGLFAIITCGVWWCLERVTERTRGVSGPGVMCAWTLGASQVFAIGLSDLQPAQTCTVLAAALGAAIPVALWRPRLTLAFGGATVPVVVTAAVLLQSMLWGVGTTGEKWTYVALLALAAILPLGADFGPLARLPDAKRTMARAVLAALGVGLCVGVAVILRPPPLPGE